MIGLGEHWLGAVEVDPEKPGISYTDYYHPNLPGFQVENYRIWRIVVEVHTGATLPEQRVEARRLTDAQLVRSLPYRLHGGNLWARFVDEYGDLLEQPAPDETGKKWLNPSPAQ